MDERDSNDDGILAGLDDLADTWLGLQGNSGFGRPPAYTSRTAAIDLSTKGGSLAQGDAVTVDTHPIQNMLACIDSNWKRLGSRSPSAMVWELRKATHLADNNESPEKVLEKLIVLLLDDSWFNQIPTCSGMARRREAQRSVDLGHDCGNGEFEFIELKYGTVDKNFGANHPLHAAIKVLQYGLLFAHAMTNGLCRDRSDSNPLLKATVVHLRVLAPSGYYRGFNFQWLENSMNAGLGLLEAPVKLDFQFQHFSPEFDILYHQPVSLAESVRAFQRDRLQSRKPVYG